MVEGGRGVCWADQKEAIKGEKALTCPEGVTLSPLTESDVRLDVPPSSVLLCHTRPAPVMLQEADDTQTMSSKLDATVVLHSVDLDSTFDVNHVVEVVEQTAPPEAIFKVNIGE